MIYRSVSTSTSPRPPTHTYTHKTQLHVSLSPTVSSPRYHSTTLSCTNTCENISESIQPCGSNRGYRSQGRSEAVARLNKREVKSSSAHTAKHASPCSNMIRLDYARPRALRWTMIKSQHLPTASQLESFAQ